jgi:hypothetical protein
MTLPYDKLEKTIVIDHDGAYKDLLPEEKATCQQQLRLAVHEKMMGLLKSSSIDWHAIIKTESRVFTGQRLRGNSALN